jgi:DNA polymerase-3 subunit alpha
MREETGEASIIGWALEHNPEELREWCQLKDNGELDGPLAIEFAQAIRLEGTKRSMGKHASGLIISPTNLSDIVPMIYDKTSEEMIVGLDMRDAENMGLMKYDLLGLRTLDCIMDAEAIIRGADK